jgi:hypothetical protein
VSQHDPCNAESAFETDHGWTAASWLDGRTGGPPGDLTYSAAGLPPGIRIGPDGALSGTVSARALGTHTVTLTTTGPTRVLRQVTFDWIVL